MHLNALRVSAHCDQTMTAAAAAAVAAAAKSAAAFSAAYHP